MRRRIASEPALRAAMAIGAALARCGELQRPAERALRDRPAALERQRQLAASGSQLERRVLRRYARAASSGPARSATGGWRTSTGTVTASSARPEDLAAELGCAESAVRGDLSRLPRP